MKTFQFLFDLPEYQQTRNPKLIAGGHWQQGVIRTKSIEELASQVKSIALWLLDNGIEKEDRIILLVNHFNLEWLATDMGIMAVGAISVPVHYPQRESDLKFIFDRIQPALLIHSTEISKKVIPATGKSIPFETLVKTE